MKSMTTSEDDIDDVISLTSMKTIDFMSSNIKVPSKPSVSSNKSSVKEKPSNLWNVPSVLNSTPLGLMRKARIREPKIERSNLNERNKSQPSFIYKRT